METCKNNSVAKYMSKQAMGSTTPDSDKWQGTFTDTCQNHSPTHRIVWELSIDLEEDMVYW